MPERRQTARPFSAIGVTIALVSVVAAATADEEPAPPIEDLFKTDLVFPQGQGELQLSTFPTFRKGAEGRALELPIGAEYGITDSLQLEVEWDAYIDFDANEADQSASGQGNVGLGLMYSLLDIGDRGFNAALGFEYEFASGDRGLLDDGNRKDSQTLYLIFAQDLAPDLGRKLFLQAGVELQGRRRSTPLAAGLEPDEDDGREDAATIDPMSPGAEDDGDDGHDPNVWFANVGGYTTLNAVVLSLELNLSEEQEERYVTPGISFKPIEPVEIGLGLAAGLTEEADDYQIIAKFVWEFGD